MSVSGDDQQQLIRRIGRALLGAAPPNWKQIRAEYRSAGRHIEADVLVTGEDGQPHPIRPPMDVVDLFGELRAAMYQPGRGTWMSGVYLLDHPSKYSAEFEPDTEPRWRRLPPPIGFQDELRRFPREDNHIPEWLRARAGLPADSGQPAPPGPGQPTPGQPASGPPVPGSIPPSAIPGQPTPGPLPGQAGQGQLIPGETGFGQVSPSQPAPGATPAHGLPLPSYPEPGQASAGHSVPAHPASGPIVDLPLPAQPSPEEERSVPRYPSRDFPA